MTGLLGPLAIELLYLLCAVCALALGGWLLARRKERGPAVVAKAVALALTAAWALAGTGLGVADVATAALLSLTYLAWLWTLYRLFAPDERDKSVGPVRPVVLALDDVEVARAALGGRERLRRGGLVGIEPGPNLEEAQGPRRGGGRAAPRGDPRRPGPGACRAGDDLG